MNKFSISNKALLKISTVILAVIVVQGCSSDDDDSSLTTEPVINADGSSPTVSTLVSANDGGTFSSDDGQLRITVPPGALTKDSNLLVTPVSTSLPSGSLASAGNSFNIDVGGELSIPIAVEITIERPPTHPELAELALLNNDEWTSTSANFFRRSDNTIVSLINASGTYQAAYRTLQTETGDGVARGREIFLNETFNNEAFFGGVIGLHELLNGLTPTQAVGVGVQVDVARVPQPIVDVLTGDDNAAKQIALDSPDTTRALLRADAVVGVKAFFGEGGNSELATSAGITCAVCHTRVEPTEFELSDGQLTPLPIGPLNLDGVPNTAMDVGTILSLTPFAENAGQDTVDFLQAFGAGRFDARSLPDNPLEDDVLNATSIPPLWNFIDLEEQGYGLNWDGLFASADEPNNALASRAELVFDLVMHANGAFGTESAGVSAELANPPSQDLLDALVAAEDEAPGNDIDTQSLLDIQSWQRSITSPAPGEFDEALAEEGFRLFNDAEHAKCATCHLTPEFTGPVKSAEITLEPPVGGLADGVKTPGLRGVSHVPPYLHDDSAKSLMDVIDIYSGRIVAELSESEKLALVEYLKSL